MTTRKVLHSSGYTANDPEYVLERLVFEIRRLMLNGLYSLISQIRTIR